MCKSKLFTCMKVDSSLFFLKEARELSPYLLPFDSSPSAARLLLPITSQKAVLTLHPL